MSAESPPSRSGRRKQPSQFTTASPSTMPTPTSMPSAPSVNTFNFPTTSSSTPSSGLNQSLSSHAHIQQRSQFLHEPKPPPRPDKDFELIIRQQPVRARMCGFSDTKDRRLIDPPPILQLFFKNGSERIALSPRECTTLVCHASLWSPNGKEERNIVVNPRGSGEGGEVGDKDDLKPVPIDKLSVNESRLCQALVGSLATPCMILNDVDGTEGMFFVFYDLSVRTQGSFRLKFHLIDADSTKEFSAAKSVLWTNVFEVYSPKTFPGMTESTDLSRTFAKQGLPIHIRKDYSTSKEQSTAQTPLDLD